MSAPADDDLLEMFRAESAERLDRVGDALLAIERGEADDDVVNSTLREVHSIKGAAGMLGLDVAGVIAHAMEDVLVEARARGHLRPETVDPLLRASDLLRGAIESEDVDPAPALAALSAVDGGSEPGRGGPAGVNGPAQEDAAAPVRGQRADDHTRSLRVDAARLDAVVDTVGEAVAQQRELEHLLTRPAEVPPEQLDEALHRADLRLDHLQQAVIELRMVPLSSITGPFPRMVRDAAAASGKEVELTFAGVATQLDRVVLEGASEAISHLLRNAVAHGIEAPEDRERAGKPRSGSVELRAQQHGDRVVIEVADDGGGVAPDLIARADNSKALARVLAAPGLTRAEGSTALAGRGVGLDAVLEHVQRIGGELEVQTQPGRGTTFRLLVPISLALMHVLLAERGSALFGIPMAAVDEVVDGSDPLVLGGRTSVEFRGEALSLADPVALLGGPARPLAEGSNAIVASGGGARAALAFDAVLGDDEVLIKPLGPLLTGTAGYLGTAIAGEGRIVMVLDPAHVLPAAERQSARSAISAGEPPRPIGVPTAHSVLVVDDQFTAREIQRSILEAAGYSVTTARDGREAWDLIAAGANVELVVTDLEMPEMDGLELLRKIRADAAHGSLPVVVVTSRGSEDDERKGLEAGADAYVVKQRFDQRALIDTVERLVST